MQRCKNCSIVLLLTQFCHNFSLCQCGNENGVLTTVAGLYRDLYLRLSVEEVKLTARCNLLERCTNVLGIWAWSDFFLTGNLI